MIITEEYLASRASLRNITNNSESRILNENNFIFTKNKTYDVFLSHSIKDKVKIFALLDLFNNCNYSVYVDWLNDPQLDRSQVNVTTANLLQTRMNASKGLALYATSNSFSSKWCPWELGYFDGKKNKRCCILPVLNTSQSVFKGLEYLGLYPYLEYIPSTSKNDFWVIDNNNNNLCIELSTWLSGINPCKRKV
jgi:hypothetical protein